LFLQSLRQLFINYNKWMPLPYSCKHEAIQITLCLIWFHTASFAVLVSSTITEILLLENLWGKRKLLSVAEFCFFIYFLCSVKCQSDKLGIWKPYQKKPRMCCGRHMPILRQDLHQHKDSSTEVLCNLPLRCNALACSSCHFQSVIQA
jgi:hypothetical protein